jgi:hypothetical protein
MLLGLLAVYTFVLVCPDLTVGTSLQRVAARDAGRDAHFAAWHVSAPSVALLRSPEPRRTPAHVSAHEAGSDPVQLSRPSDPLTRLEQTHLAQYGGDLEALTGASPAPLAPSASPGQ